MNTIRRAEEKDIPAILELLIQVDMVHHEGRPDIFKGPATKYNAEELKSIVKNDETPVFVCVDDKGQVIGHAFCIHKQVLGDHVLTDIRTLYIDDLCVDEAFRGRHIGQELYRYVLSYAGQTGSQAVILHVEKKNTSAMRFYERMGYSIFRDDGDRYLLKKDI